MKCVGSRSGENARAFRSARTAIPRRRPSNGLRRARQRHVEVRLPLSSRSHGVVHPMRSSGRSADSARRRSPPVPTMADRSPTDRPGFIQRDASAPRKTTQHPCGRANASNETSASRRSRKAGETENTGEGKGQRYRGGSEKREVVHGTSIASAIASTRAARSFSTAKPTRAACEHRSRHRAALRSQVDGRSIRPSISVSKKFARCRHRRRSARRSRSRLPEATSRWSCSKPHSRDRPVEERNDERPDEREAASPRTFADADQNQANDRRDERALGRTEGPKRQREEPRHLARSERSLALHPIRSPCEARTRA